MPKTNCCRKCKCGCGYCPTECVVGLMGCCHQNGVKEKELDANNYFGFGEILNEWIKQGRSEEAIWGVKNFLTGIGGVKISQLLKEKEAEAEERGYKVGFYRGIENLKERKAQARLQAYEEIEKFVDKINTDGGGNGRRLKEQLLSFIKENKTND